MRRIACITAAAALVTVVAGCESRTYHRSAYHPGYTYYTPATGYGYYSPATQTAYAYGTRGAYYREYRGMHPPAETAYPY
ncbi:MAG: hypothetical protein KIT25_07990 [Enhydrobacter sp.]|nr:MAG: hypothetical protein KIT25_07990 [Enhydrobacter sp.]